MSLFQDLSQKFSVLDDESLSVFESAIANISNGYGDFSTAIAVFNILDKVGPTLSLRGEVIYM